MNSPVAADRKEPSAAHDPQAPAGAARWDLRFSAGLAFVIAGFCCCTVSGLDPTRASLAIWGCSGAVIGVWLTNFSARRRRSQWLRHVAALALLYGMTAPVVPRYQADWVGYVGTLRSVAFDQDLDFENEWVAFGTPTNRRTATGLLENSTPIGAAFLWSPFYLAAHVYVGVDRRFGAARFEQDGLSIPYLRATRLGTLSVVYAGAIALINALCAGFGLAVSTLSVVASILTSTALYYSVVLAAMAHGVAWGVAAAMLAQWIETHRQPTRGRWLRLGALLGLLTLCRWQGAVYIILVLPLALFQWFEQRVEARWLALAGAGTLLVITPQFVAWKIIYGSFITIPQGGGFVGWGSPNFWNTLISADHGFFNWTPVMFLGFVGLWSFMGRQPLLCLGSLGVFFATAWVNGSVPGHDWQGGDAFGARRFTLIVPLMAVGLAAFVRGLNRLVQRFPLVLAATTLGAATLWNIGFIDHFNNRSYQGAAPLTSLARDQVESSRGASRKLFSRVFGDDGAALVYKIFSAEYFYTSFNRSGTINLYTADKRYLWGGWGGRSRRSARRTFRRALYPEACLRIALDERFDLRITITARRPSQLSSQQMAISMNGHRQSTVRLTGQFREVAVTVVESDLVLGENRLCLGFANQTPGEPPLGGVGAELERVQLP